jgi:hypothetical protein
MFEKRRHERVLTLKTADILFDKAGNARECAIVDISEGGACLLVETSLDLPDTFELTTHRDGLTRTCHVAWRSAHKVGVSFDGEPRFMWQVTRRAIDERPEPH